MSCARIMEGKNGYKVQECEGGYFENILGMGWKPITNEVKIKMFEQRWKEFEDKHIKLQEKRSLINRLGDLNWNKTEWGVR